MKRVAAQIGGAREDDGSLSLAVHDDELVVDANHLFRIFVGPKHPFDGEVGRRAAGLEGAESDDVVIVLRTMEYLDLGCDICMGRITAGFGSGYPVDECKHHPLVVCRGEYGVQQLLVGRIEHAEQHRVLGRVHRIYDRVDRSAFVVGFGRKENPDRSVADRDLVRPALLLTLGRGKRWIAVQQAFSL